MPKAQRIHITCQLHLIIISIINGTVQETRSLGLCKAALHNATAVYT